MARGDKVKSEPASQLSWEKVRYMIEKVLLLCDERLLLLPSLTVERNVEGGQDYLHLARF